MFEKPQVGKNESNHEDEKDICKLFDQLPQNKKRILERKAFNFGIGSLDSLKECFKIFEKENPGNESLSALIKKFNTIMDDSEVGYYVGKYIESDFYPDPVKKIDKTEFDSFVPQDESEMVYEVYKGGGNSQIRMLADDIFHKMIG